MSDVRDQKEQREAVEHCKSVRVKAAEIQQKLESGDLHGALARIGFLMQRLGDCIQELNAAMGKANENGYLPPLPRVPEEG